MRVFGATGAKFRALVPVDKCPKRDYGLRNEFDIVER
jgi:hypothetical protein